MNPPAACCRLEGHTGAILRGPCFVLFRRALIYVDSFNHYFRMLKQRPAFRWLDLRVH
jgi:hypothetical protein